MISKQFRWISGSLSLVSLAWAGRADAAVPISPDTSRLSVTHQSAPAQPFNDSFEAEVLRISPEPLPEALSRQQTALLPLSAPATQPQPIEAIQASSGAASLPAPLLEIATPRPDAPQLSQRPGQEDRFNAPEPETDPLPSQQPPVLPEPPETPPETRPETPPETSPTSPETSPDEPRVAVQEIQVLGSTVFDEADFDPILADYEGRDLTIQELRQAADAVTQLYLNEGYITSRAILSNQTIENGVVQLQVVEGSLADIQVEGADRLARYVRDRIELGADTPLSQIDLENQLRLLRVDPLIDNIEASLRAGEGLGESLLIVRVDAADPIEAHLIVDTDSPPSVGTVRTGAEVVYRNPLGIGDQLRASAFRATTGGSELYELSYRAPINAMNGTISARILPSEFEIIDPAEIAALDVSGSADVYELSYRQPLIRTPQEEFALSLGFRHRDGETLLSGFKIDESSTSVVQFGQDYVRRDVSGAWALRSQFNLGTGLLDATNRDGEADGQFLSWLGQVQRAQVLNQNNILILQGDVQLATDSLLGSEQFVVGGGQSVRGYSQNARFGDNGVRLSAEDRIVVDRDESGTPILQLAPFVDMAAVWNTESDTAANDDNFLLGTGVGLLYRPIDQLNIRFDVGVPLVELDEPGDSAQDVFIYLNLDYRL
ncbi:MAG: ShlB/FhaC/HecB family hemolysin secretion/activation protein [Cyanobacteria bacterium P01_A01_bin.114]